LNTNTTNHRSSTQESVAIPKNPRNDRPVGYAFVDLATPGEAERAIAKLSGQEILERKVSVQLARAPASPAEKAERSGDHSEGGRRRPATRGRGRGRGRYSRGGRNGGSDGGREHREDDNAGAHEVKALGDITNKQPADRAERVYKTEDKPFGGYRRERGPPSDGVPSKTKVMVANLPYDLTEEKLKELFSAYQPSSAKIALRPIPRFMIKKLQARGEARKGRGFGFVTLASEEMQQKAVTEMNGKEIEGREIAVKVAIDSPDKTDTEASPSARSDEAAEPKDADAAPVAPAPALAPVVEATA
jgi:RNA recognition motif-containing protein